MPKVLINDKEFVTVAFIGYTYRVPLPYDNKLRRFPMIECIYNGRDYIGTVTKEQELLLFNPFK